MSDLLLRWCVDQLNRNFGLDACDDIVQYILSIENAEEIREYVGDLLQGTEGKKQQFMDELLDRWHRSRQPSSESIQLYHRKETVADVPEVLKGMDSLKKSKRKGRNKQEVPTVPEQEPAPEEVKTPIDLLKAQESSSSTTVKKKKFVNLYAQEGQDRLAVLLPGRHPCECLAQKHRLINNCLTCGRIVCEQENSGPCLFCGSLVCTKEEQEIIQRDSNKSQKLLKKLMGGGDRASQACGTEREFLPQQEARTKSGLEKALQHKEKLLEYDRNSVRRTQVIDDESDYFATDSNQWLPQAEREALRRREEELRELRHASRLGRKVTLDFAGRRVLEEGEGLSHYYSKLDETVQAISTGSLARTPTQPEQGTRQHLGELVNPNIMQAAPVWVEVGSSEVQRKARDKAGVTEPDSGRSRLRIQDRELQEIADGGWCLSMHQPWASLLIRGIKRVEGRTWYTSHRGRLWIAAAAKRPTPQETAQVEAMYRKLYRTAPDIPREYPTGCLLGCVNVTDCLSQEQYQKQFPDTCEESGSPFVFICSNPQELLVKFPMKGKHKIWKLDSQYHQAAKKGLMHQKSAY
uniref:Activating signal cointegrator 1 n=1 Tax=Lepisosteus oculatus TaxID=7918 RepID=W5NCV2_LEPOC|nr:PREDICTED: activating signal cointegrator 1 [Lepisosteus oculatus]